MVVMVEEGHDLALVPFATVAPSESAQFQLFEATPLRPRGVPMTNIFPLHLPQLRGRKKLVLESSPTVSASIDAQIVEVTSELLVGRKIQVFEVALEEVITPEKVVGA